MSGTRITRHARSHGADGTDPIDVGAAVKVEALATDETDTTKVLAPDGGGGLTFRGGSITITLLDGSGAVVGVATLRADSFVDNGGGDVSLFPGIVGSGGGFLDFNGHPRLLDDDTTPSTGLDLATHRPILFAEHTPGALADAGVGINVGTDYVGWWISEKDSVTIQVYAYDPGGFDTELVDRGTHFWKHVAVDGGVATPSLGMLPQYSSAPSSPVEGQSYYDLTLHKARTWDGSAWQNWW